MNFELTRTPLCLLIAGVLAVCPATSQTARIVAQRSLPSVVLLTMSDANGHPISLGSGFVVTNGIVATNLHVIAGAFQGQAKFVGQSRTYSILGTVGIDELNDLALLKVVGQTGSALALGDSDDVSVGDDVYVAGNPEGLEGTLSSGIVSAWRQLQEHKLLQITAPISPGSSGGPVLNAHGEVIGVAVATWKGGQNLNFAVPSSYLTKLLANVGFESPLNANPRKPPSANDALGGEVADAIQITHRTISCEHGFNFSIRNSLPHAIENVTLLFVFHDKSGDATDFVQEKYPGQIPPGLAKATYGPRVNDTLLEEHIGRKWVLACTNLPTKGFPAERYDLSFIEVRILGFRLLEE